MQKSQTNIHESQIPRIISKFCGGFTNTHFASAENSGTASFRFSYPKNIPILSSRLFAPLNNSMPSPHFTFLYISLQPDSSVYLFIHRDKWSSGWVPRVKMSVSLVDNLTWTWREIFLTLKNFSRNFSAFFLAPFILLNTDLIYIPRKMRPEKKYSRKPQYEGFSSS